MPIPRIKIVRRYMEGCSLGDREMILATLTPDCIHYFLHRDPVVGAEAIADLWLRTREWTMSRWTVDRAVSRGDLVAVEWTQHGHFPGRRQPSTIRGSEWYHFQDGLIGEIRAYLHPSPYMGDSELRRYPYHQRGYPVFTVGRPDEAADA